jgi:mono/diheme cytochrome c family protein
MLHQYRSHLAKKTWDIIRTGALVAMIAAGMAVLNPFVAPLRADEPVTAEQMFSDTCSRCHGPQGFGDGPDGMTLGTHPRNFHDCALMAKDSDEKVFEEIKGGSASIGRSNDMPSWGEALSDDEIRHLIVYVRNFCKGK